jgi:hypothetical protein
MIVEIYCGWRVGLLHAHALRISRMQERKVGAAQLFIALNVISHLQTILAKRTIRQIKYRIIFNMVQSALLNNREKVNPDLVALYIS